MALQYGNQATFTVTLAGPFGGSGAGVKLAQIELKKDNWKGSASPYFQEVEVAGVSVNSMVNLQPNAQQQEIFREKEIAFTAENVGGKVTVYVVGDKPTQDHTFQATITEVIV